MSGIDKIVAFIDKIMDGIRPPAFQLPPQLLWCTAVKKDGMSSVRATTDIVADLRGLGWDMSKNKDGTSNRLTQLVYAVTNGIMREMRNHASVTTVITPGQIQITALGANAAGEVTSNGTTINFSSSHGRIS